MASLLDALHPPLIFRAPRVGDGRSTPVLGRVTLHTSSSTQKNYMKRDDRYIYRYIYKLTSRLLERIGLRADSLKITNTNCKFSPISLKFPA